MTDQGQTWAVAVTANTSQMQNELKNATQLGRQFSAAMGTAFDGIAVKGRGLTEVLRTMTLTLSRMVVQAAFKPLEQSLGLALSNVLAGSGGFGFASGGVLQQGMPVPFAKGGVIASPVTFPLASGRVGLAGERGAEAIMPLTRGPDGRLGVAAQGGGGIAVTVNVTSPDVAGFQRSETQVAAMLARAVALGQRNI